MFTSSQVCATTRPNRTRTTLPSERCVIGLPPRPLPPPPTVTAHHLPPAGPQLVFARSHNNLSKYVSAATDALRRVGSPKVDAVQDFGSAVGGGYGVRRVERGGAGGRAGRRYWRLTVAALQWKDVASVVAYVIIPYTKSYMFLFEAYALNVPLFVPERSLLASVRELPQRTRDPTLPRAPLHPRPPRHHVRPPRRS